MEDEFAGLSGATLGFITGNVPGAVTGYKVGKRLSRAGRATTEFARSGYKRVRESGFFTPRFSMAPRMMEVDVPDTPVNTTRIRSRYAPALVRVKTPSLRAKGINKRSKSKRRTRTRSSRGSLRKPAFKSKKRVNRKKTRKVKVSRILRKKITKVINGKNCQGYYEKMNTGVMRNTEQSLQAVHDLGIHFAPNAILNAASILWNQQVPTWSVPPIDAARALPYFTTKVQIKKCWSTFEFKSNSQRINHLKIFVCTPKVTHKYDQPQEHWKQLLTDLYLEGINVSNTQQTCIHTDPRSLPQWNKYWNADVTKLTLEPGQSYKFTVDGPTDKFYDMGKMFKADNTDATNTIQFGQKTAKYVFVVHYLELTGTTLGGVDRAKNFSADEEPAGILYEERRFFSLTCPQNAGWITPALTIPNEPVPLELVRDAYCVVNFDSGDLDGDQASRVEVTNPQVASDPSLS